MVAKVWSPPAYTRRRQAVSVQSESFSVSEQLSMEAVRHTLSTEDWAEYVSPRGMDTGTYSG